MIKPDTSFHLIIYTIYVFKFCNQQSKFSEWKKLLLYDFYQCIYGEFQVDA